MNRLIQKLNSYRITLKNQSNGDTIVEVLVSVTVLSLVLAVSFVSSSRSLEQGVAATNRQQANSFAQQQVELIKNDPTSYESHVASANFCISNNGTKLTPDTTVGGTDPCQFGNQYSLSDQYSFNTGIFTVTATWQGPSGPDSLTLYYKVASASYYRAPDIKLVTDHSHWPVGGGTSTLTWTLSNVTNCSFTSSPTNANWDNNPSKNDFTDGDHSVQISLTSYGNYNFYLSCDNGGAPANAQQLITVDTPVPTIDYFTADSYTVGPGYDGYPYGNVTALNWGSSNSNNCSADNFDTGGNTGGRTNVSLNATTTYTLTCYGDGGASAPFSRTVTYVPAPPPPKPSISDFYPDTPAVSEGNPSLGEPADVIYTQNGVYRTFSAAFTNASSCNINGQHIDVYGSHTSPATRVYPNTVYTLSCDGPGGNDQKSWGPFNYDSTFAIVYDFEDTNHDECGRITDWGGGGCSTSDVSTDLYSGLLSLRNAEGECATFGPVGPPNPDNPVNYPNWGAQYLTIDPVPTGEQWMPGVDCNGY